MPLLIEVPWLESLSRNATAMLPAGPLMGNGAEWAWSGGGS